MRHAIEFQADQLTENQFGSLLRRLAEEVAKTEDHQLVVTGHRAGDEYSARALPVPMGSYVTDPSPVRGADRNDLVAALFRYYVGTERA
jgi:hypothetical protein